MGIEISIIMPSYNKYPLNLYGLYSLNRQHFDPDKMEVILIDDSSTDQTPKLKNMTTPYPFRYIRCDTNGGRSRTRNLGIEAAKGKLILLLDGEMIVTPDFVKNHFNHHHEEDNLIVTGAMTQKGVYTTLFPLFQKNQYQKFYTLIKGNPVLQKRWRLHPNQIKQRLIRRINLIKTAKKPWTLLNKRDIETGFYKNLSFPSPIFPDLRRKYGDQLEGYLLPWHAFLTGNVSLRKDLIIEAGMFDEGFRGWGFEDLDMGYRLFKKGAHFINDPNVKNYHQIHPIHKGLNQDLLDNYNYFQQKYSDFAVSSGALNMVGLIDRLEQNVLVYEFQELSNKHTDESRLFREFYLELLQIIAHAKAKRKSIVNVAKPILSNDWKDKIETVSNQKKQVERIGKYPNLIRIFDKLIPSLDIEV